MEDYQNNNPQLQEDDEQDIDWMGILSRLLKHWKQIVFIGLFFGVIGIISALTMKRYYNVSLTLAPEIQNRNSGNLSNMAALLGLGGVQIGSSTDAMNISLFPEICKSTPFLVDLLDVPLTSYVSEGQLEQGVKPYQTTVYKHFSGEDIEKKGLAKWRYERAQKKHPEKPYSGVSDPTELTRRQARVVKGLSQSISADVDKKTGVTTVSVTMDDRMMAKQLADTVCTRLQVYVSDYRTKKATADYDYYAQLAEEARQNLVKAQAAYAASVDYDRSVILQSATAVKERLHNEANLANQLYSQMVQQRELARAKIQEDRPVYAVVQPAVLPQSSINSRVKRVLIWGFIGGLLAVAWYGFGADFFKKMRADVKERMENEE
jgi:uncharacterized protein involved in exopolysaccharide biosynthesis